MKKIILSFIASVSILSLTGCGQNYSFENHSSEPYYAEVNGKLYEITSHVTSSVGTVTLYLKDGYTFTTSDGKIVTSHTISTSCVNVIIYTDCEN